jgi:hypothetical protein
MEPAYIALIVIAWVLLDAIIVAGLVLLRLRVDRRVRRAGRQLAGIQVAALHCIRRRQLSVQRR